MIVLPLNDDLPTRGTLLVVTDSYYGSKSITIRRRQFQPHTAIAQREGKAWSGHCLLHQIDHTHLSPMCGLVAAETGDSGNAPVATDPALPALRSRSERYTSTLIRCDPSEH